MQCVYETEFSRETSKISLRSLLELARLNGIRAREWTLWLVLICASIYNKLMFMISRKPTCTHENTTQSNIDAVEAA